MKCIPIEASWICSRITNCERLKSDSSPSSLGLIARTTSCRTPRPCCAQEKDEDHLRIWTSLDFFGLKKALALTSMVSQGLASAGHVRPAQFHPFHAFHLDPAETKLQLVQTMPRGPGKRRLTSFLTLHFRYFLSMTSCRSSNYNLDYTRLKLEMSWTSCD